MKASERSDLNPLLLNIPAELQTDRLLLRSPRPGDGLVVFPTVIESLPDLKLWMPWAKDDYSENDAEEWCRRNAGEFLLRRQIQFLIFSRTNPQHLGNIGAFKFDWEIPSCEIGYWLCTSQTGRGLMTEAVNVLVSMLQQTLKMRRIQLRCDSRNLRSRAVALRAGFKLEGIHLRDSLDQGKVRDTCVFSRIFDPPE